MKKPSKSMLLEETLELLVRHFGPDSTRRALSNIVGDTQKVTQITQRTRVVSKPKMQPSISDALEQIGTVDPVKYHVISEFYLALNEREVLPESQDIRHFAQAVGLKQIGGKSRRDLIPPLMRFLIPIPTDRLRGYVQIAGDISERQRRQGFSVLTDKLLGKR